ncbi:HEPN domain-containing protein [Hoeflea prorocentri]|uniref:RiboL-PSP-HEPN domain-containing protein n=1 Tax=Hoeflea prorocentri TaxID=1922333 RepID=A0A9X3ZFL7_9HYPH|nr:HEPN domain-containing protein [Hoeflea prorocentri]MCY6379348.1 hypothetical protein [Hoeflea prorocentri]MDA5397149.1 hypothetical protein [Hoeflea prorocentri]
MSDFVDYARTLMDAAKGFAEKAEIEKRTDQKQAFLRAALLHGVSFLEAHINEISDHFKNRSILSVHEKGVLLEREVRLEKGSFRLSATPKFSRMTDRIELLLKKFSDDVAASKGTWFSKLQAAIDARNRLVHPKEVHSLSHIEVIGALQAIIDCVDALFRAVFKKPLPYKGKYMGGGLDL